ncbi:unnamed protein product [Durusdinium trenchii]|uniref:Uncharacterized protein n=2 Tax=Durusdinium trenchii TaxID=1381693 RepID=A0ABP0PCU2_9DINO
MRCRSCRSCSRRTARRLWSWIPKTGQEALESLLGKAYFGLMCARWAALFFWEDRQELLADAKSAIWQELSGHNAPPPPKSRRQVSEELQPFRWALYVALLYSLWDMISKVTRGFA